MNTNSLKKFATAARTQLIREVNDQLTAVLASDSLARKERPADVRRLEKEEKTDRKELVERVAYTWFNRLAALTYMDRNGYSADLFAELQTAHVVTPAEGQRVPELLQLARAGQFDSALKLDKDRLTRLLTGQLNSENADAEVYRALLIATCNLWHDKMPFLFEKLDDYTELLVPSDLLSERSVLSAMQNELTAEVCEDVEVIGWLYQFYIADLKAEIDLAVKKGKKVEAETLPAKTGLYTPHWIVKYLVQNSLGRLWLLNNPTSDLVDSLEYYIDPRDEAGDFLKVLDPEKIRFCDPACGSGHILTYAFDVLMQIYTSKSYRPSEAVASILQHNLFGVEIDKRAGDLAALALTMKARAYDKRFFRRSEIAVPNICILENVSISDQELESYLSRVGRDLFSADLKETLSQFVDARNVGSLIQPVMGDVEPVLQRIDGLKFEEDLFLEGTHRKVQLTLKQAYYLSKRYHVVVANPPYLGGKHMNAKLKAFAKTKYPNSKSDLFAMFIDRGVKFVVKNGYSAQVTMQSWMFLSSFEDMRQKLFLNTSIESLVHMGNGVMGIAFGTNATVWKNSFKEKSKGAYLYVENTDVSDGELSEFPPQNERNSAIPDSQRFYRASAEDFGKIPGSPVAYWVNREELGLYNNGVTVKTVCHPAKGIDTGYNDRFIRLWHEISFEDFSESRTGKMKWYPYNKGGDYRKWYGNREYVVLWENDGAILKSRLQRKTKKPTIRNVRHHLQQGWTWTTVSSGGFSLRKSDKGFMFDNGGCSLFAEPLIQIKLAALLNSTTADRYLEFLSPTLNFQPGDIGRVLWRDFEIQPDLVEKLVSLSKHDWDSYERSWEFQAHPITTTTTGSLRTKYEDLQILRQVRVETFSEFERTINSAVAKAYRLEGYVADQRSREKISLDSNPSYRFSGDDLSGQALKDTIENLFSYFNGCAFGRYSLDKPGLILANAGDGMKEYLAQVPEPSFMPDEDGIVPFVESGWFKDDVVREWERFLTVAFGQDHLEENKAFVKETLGKSVRQYFLKDFYPDHIKRYKKRPIYWMFASQPEKGRGIPAFQCLVYLHRYTTDTCGKIMEDYLKPLIRQLEDKLREAEEIGSSTSEQISAREKTQALKDADDFRIKLKECKTYAETLQPYVDNPIALDLDDGVLVNYNRFGKAVKLVPGLNDKKQRDKVRGFDWCDVSKVPRYGE